MSLSNFRGGRMNSVSALSQIVGDVEHDFNDYKDELTYLRSIVYPTVQVLSPKTIGTYAEVGFTIPRTYIRRYGLCVLVESFLKDVYAAQECDIQANNRTYLIPSVKSQMSHEDKKEYVVTFLVIASHNTHFISACQKFTNNDVVKKVVLYVNDLMYSLSSFDNCCQEFEKDICKFLDADEPVYFEITKYGCINQLVGKMTTSLVMDS